MVRQKIPKIVSIFVSKFDVMEGNRLVWSHCSESINLKGLEFKSMPSGSHQKDRDVVYFVQPDDTFGVMPGVAVYRQTFERDANGKVNRATVNMYSLGVICKPESDSLATKVWVFIKDLERLVDRIGANAQSVCNATTFDHIANYLSSNLVNYDLSYRHPISRCVDFIRHYRELIFPLWRCALLRKRLLLVNCSGLDCETFSDFTHILHLLSTITKDISSTLQGREIFSNLLYTVGLTDLDWLQSDSPEVKSYIATTTDEIIVDKRRAYDVAVISRPTGIQVVFADSSKSQKLTYSARDARRFSLLTESLEINVQGPRSCISSISNIPRNMSNLVATNVYGFLWWASAGEQSNLDGQTDADGLPLLGDTAANDTDTCDTEADPWEITFVGYFHQMIRRLFKATAYLVENQLLHEDDRNWATIEPPDLLEMGLDPLSPEDRAFAISFIELWFDRNATVNNFLPNVYCC